MGAKGARGRRFERGLAPLAAEMNASTDFDRRLLEVDVMGSIAHAKMLASCGIIPSDDAEAIRVGLLEVMEEFKSGARSFDKKLEDVHMNVEARLIEKIGDAGRRLHTARSRNDQVSTDMRMYARRASFAVQGFLDMISSALVDVAEANLDLVMPGYTHLQRAQPIRVAHHLLAYVAMFDRDRTRLFDATARANECPLGAGALAATPFAIDREQTAAELGFFAGPTRNSLDAAGDRDFAIELVSALALCQVHLSRLGEELVLWLSQEFRFASLSEDYCSGSSIMPQKVNPDLAELIRGKAGRVVGDWVSLVTTVKGLPLAYNKDLQETQEPLYDAVDTVTNSLRIAEGMIRSLTFDGERLRAAVKDGYLVATEVADYLVDKGMAFREAHDISGALVRTAMKQGVELSALTMEQFKSESELFGDDIFAWLDIDAAVDRRNVVGGPAREQITQEITRIRGEIEDRWPDGSEDE